MLAAMKIAFIGLGRMGMGMARNLLRAGHIVAAYNRSREKAEALADSGARIASSPADACRDAEVVMTMVADDQAVEEIVFGNHGIASAMKRDCIHVSHSTISTALARKLTAEHGQRNQGYMSVPVFGRPEQAESKNLVVVAAGPGELVERCRLLFDAIGRQTYRNRDRALAGERRQIVRQFHDRQPDRSARRSFRDVAESRRCSRVVSGDHEHFDGIPDPGILWPNHCAREI